MPFERPPRSRVIPLAVVVWTAISVAAAQTIDDLVREAEAQLSADPVRATKLAEAAAEQLNPDTPPSDRAQVYVIAAEAAAMLGDAQGALEAAAAGLSQDSLTPTQRVRLLLARGIGLDMTGTAEDPLEVYKEAVAVASTLPERRFHAMALSLRGLTRARMKDYQDALSDVLAAHELLDSIESLQYQADVLTAVGLVYSQMDQPAKALPFLRQALSRVEALGSDQQLSVAWYNIALQQQTLGSHDEALAAFEQSLAFSRSAGDEIGAAYARYGIGDCLGHLGRHQSARETLSEVVARFDDLGDAGMQVVARTDLAEACLRSGDASAAQRLLAEAEKIAVETDNRRRLVKIYRVLAETRVELGDYRGATEAYAQFIERHLEDDDERLRRQMTQAMVELGTEVTERRNQELAEENEARRRELERQLALKRRYATAAAVAILVAIVVIWLVRRNLRLQAHVVRLATLDELTGIPNRREVLRLAEIELQRALRYGHTVTIGMVDIDRFKRINDSFGHAAGDEVLRAVATSICSVLRQHDVFGRIGGDEFLVALPHTQIDQAEAAVDRMRDELRQQTRDRPTQCGEVTVSVGLAVVPSAHEKHGLTLQTLVSRADQALYDAKRSGRNTTRVWIAAAGEP